MWATAADMAQIVAERAEIRPRISRQQSAMMAEMDDAVSLFDAAVRDAGPWTPTLAVALRDGLHR